MPKKSRRANRQTRHDGPSSLNGSSWVVDENGQVHYDAASSNDGGNWLLDDNLYKMTKTYCNSDLQEYLSPWFKRIEITSGENKGSVTYGMDPKACLAMAKVLQEEEVTNTFLPTHPEQEMIEGEYAARHFLHDMSLRSRVLNEAYKSIVKKGLNLSTLQDEITHMAKTMSSFARKSGICAACGKFAWERCGVCMDVHYCTKICQKRHWKEHKLVCKKVENLL